MAEPSGSNYPTTIDDGTSLLAAVTNQKSYVVSGAHSSAVTTITTTANISGVTAPGYLVCGRTGEIIHFAGISGTQFTTCTRGSDGTTNAALVDGDVLYHSNVAKYHNQLRAAILALEGTWKPESGGLVLNDDGEDRNLRVETDTDENAIFLDGGTGFLGIGNNAPTVKLDVTGAIKASTSLQAGTTLTVGGQHNRETYVIKKVFAKAGMTDNTATAVFTITTTNESGSTDGGVYTVDMRVLAFHSGLNNTDNAALGGHYAFSRAAQAAGTGQNSAVIEPTGGETAPAESEGGTTKGITAGAVTCTVTETSEYINTVNFTVDGDGGAVTTMGVVVEVTLIWYGYLTAPVLAAA